MRATISVVFLMPLGFSDGTLRDPVIAATAGGLVMYFLKDSDKVTSFLFGATGEANAQTHTISWFALSSGAETTIPSSASTCPPIFEVGIFG